MVEIDLRERFSQPLAFLPDGPVGRGFGHRGKPIEDRQPCEREQVIGPVEQFGAETAEHGAAFSTPAPYHAIMTLDLSDDEAAALAQLLRRTIDENRYPLSPRLTPLKAILAKLDPPEPRPELRPPLNAYDAPKVRRRRAGRTGAKGRRDVAAPPTLFARLGLPEAFW